MENVPGIRSVADGAFFRRVHVEGRELGYRVIAHEVQAWRFGVPQKRIRQLVIGTRIDLPPFIPNRHMKATHTELGQEARDGLEPAVTLGEAIEDLPAITSGDEQFERDYDREARAKHLKRYGDRYTFSVLRADKSPTVTAHMARPHSLRDLRDFQRLQEGENSRQALLRGVDMEFPYDRGHFRDRYTRQHRGQLCSTIVAHLKKDGLMFIHPTQLRSLTPREAARVQSFPDTFQFPDSRNRTFAQIGNAFPPLVGKAMGLAIAALLGAADTNARGAECACYLPSSRRAAIKTVEAIVESLYFRDIAALSKAEFLRVWCAVAYLHPRLHPDASRDNGSEVSRGLKARVSLAIEPIYTQSGWPVELIPIAQEARRRFEVNLLSTDEYYWSGAFAGSTTMSDSQVEQNQIAPSPPHVSP